MADQRKPSIPDVGEGPSMALISVIAVATGALVANLYYAQPLIASIAPEIGVTPNLAGSIVGIAQIGYGLGLLFLVSLADLVESKRLVLTTLTLTTIGLIGIASSSSAFLFLLASFLVGICSSSAQILVPFVAQLVPEAHRGRVLGNVMAGLLTGIMLARPAALFMAANFGWRSVFLVSAVLMVAIGLGLVRLMPKYQPKTRIGYGRILASMIGLFRDTPDLRWRSAYQALLFAAFNIFWTTAPLMLAARFGLGQQGIGLFALAGAGGALAAPIAGRLADRGLLRATTAGAMIILAVSFFATSWMVATAALIPLVILAILIDGAAQANHIVSQRIIYGVPSEVRGRANAIYMTLTFVGGAIGSVLGTLIYHWRGWNGVAVLGGAIGAAALLLLALEMRSRPRA